ncbi:B12-binding domain-containing radical SAM protein [candidate division CSSED10-310 bacterium]|uniref:B12-binding domain-containing radical SAM protein n=1 Tax=candidate division CSSED10-310 bacterium TaxID=2855610 RepID=A0ABV6YYE9_UNCC1
MGISLIASVLVSHGHSVDLFVVCQKTKRESLYKFIEHFSPQLICFSAVFSEYNFISQIAEGIRSRYSDIFLLAGGTHVTLNPDKAIKDAFDAICIGEGEFPTLELVQQLENGDEPAQIMNMWIKGKKGTEKNQTRNFLGVLDNLPFAFRDMWQKWIAYLESAHTILLGRGCPFQCSYCCNHALKKVSNGKYVRFRSPKNILSEIKEVIAHFPATENIYIEAETIGLDIKNSINLCSLLEDYNNKLIQPLSYGTNLRIIPKADYSLLFQSLKKANFDYLNIGLESGSERIRKEILNRDYSNEDFVKVVKLAKSFGFKINTYVLIGIPGEKLTDFKETIKCLRQTQPDAIRHNIFFPYPGTVLYEHCKNNELLPEKIDLWGERRRASLDLPGFSRRQINWQYNWFYYNVYKGYRPLFDIMSKLTIYRRICRLVDRS